MSCLPKWKPFIMCVCVCVCVCVCACVCVCRVCVIALNGFLQLFNNYYKVMSVGNSTSLCWPGVIQMERIIFIACMPCYIYTK